jgi:diadenosine tetraphosphate (Ap4A) HIT family hydrolase
MRQPGCALCDGDGGRVVVRSAQWRLVHAGEAGFPGFYRLAWNAHVAEFSDLTREERIACTDALAAAESCLRRHLAPAKVNLAALGNMVPHLHWHLIARYDWDSRFPAPVWAPAVREAEPDRLAALEALLPALEDDLRRHLASAAP